MSPQLAREGWTTRTGRSRRRGSGRSNYRPQLMEPEDLGWINPNYMLVVNAAQPTYGGNKDGLVAKWTGLL